MDYGWISEAGPFAQKTMLLGKPLSYYVKKKMSAAKIKIPDKVPQLKKRDRALILREDAVCMESEFLTNLLEDAPEPVLVLDVAEKHPMALALDGETCMELLKGKGKLPSLAELLVTAEQKGISVKVLDQEEFSLECLPVIDGDSYSIAFSTLNAENISYHMENGVLFLNPDNTIVETDVKIGAGTMVYPGNILQGKTEIGENCTLYPNNRMNNAVVGSGVTVESSVLLDCAVGDRTTVGPYAYLRPKANIGEGCRIGDFVEIKNANIDNGTKVSHLAYVGDGDLGKNINVSCGVVFTNYDGKNKYRSTVEDNAFIGCNCNLVAPVHVGKGAYLAAGSTVVEDVPQDALLIARSRGTIKEQWAKRRREEGKL